MNSDELKKLVDSLGGNAVLDAMRLTQEEDKLTKELRTQMEFEKTIRAPIHPTNNFPRIDLPANQNLASEFHTRLINWINRLLKILRHETMHVIPQQVQQDAWRSLSARHIVQLPHA